MKPLAIQSDTPFNSATIWFSTENNLMWILETIILVMQFLLPWVLNNIPTDLNCSPYPYPLFTSSIFVQNMQLYAGRW